ncbi:flagellar basal body-associated protein FliL [Lederbergia wuyishanensis]|uniref:Flagellar protein FliL n=1 Tax=Lederbergia wuyishanensis TaxID=1347903 RepID=A0ABU0CZQ7_9BACI|nr:flagellar basal body-associated protein FliL [Lederbergia wuyishanensis]MCJ8006272.1 flagellar basal body-associated protein FliL [Lederbergia wuyishanensis]MDQ0341641.1 flagellar FliL protein [Lederbergia wuyishanensis]
MSKKIFPTMMVVLTSILLLATLSLIIIMNLGDKDKKEPTIDEVIKVSVDVPEIMTNVKTGDYVKISFKVQTDGKKAKEEFKKRDFQIKNLIISELSEMEPSDLDGKEGKQNLEETIKGKINDLMQNGKVVRVYITSYVIS